MVDADRVGGFRSFAAIAWHAPGSLKSRHSAERLVHQEGDYNRTEGIA